MTLKTEKEKMLAGEPYYGLDPALNADRERAHALFRQFNAAASLSERQAVLRQLLGHLGQDSIIEPPFYCSYGENIHIGDCVYLNFSCTIFENHTVQIGDHVMIGPFVQIYTAAHPLRAEDRIQGFETTAPIEIEENAWIGGAAIVLPGVRIGRNAVVGAGAVVTRDVLTNTVVVGNPARVVKEIENDGPVTIENG